MRVRATVRVYSVTVIDNSGTIHNSLWQSREEAASELAAYVNAPDDALDTASLSDVMQAAQDVGLDFDVNVEVLVYDNNP